MIFKVFYQENLKEVPVREKTKIAYLEASSDKEVRQRLASKNYNIELVQELSEAHLEYEKQNPDFILWDEKE